MSDFKFLVWPTEHRRITQHFGANPHYYARFGLPGHEGVDIMAPTGSRILCVADGVVARVQPTPRGHNYGIHVRVQHEGGYETIYAHLQEASVAPGQTVRAGDVLGLADNTGNSFGSHLHLALKQAGAQVGNWPYNFIDPTPFLIPLLAWSAPAGPFITGWVLKASIFMHAGLAQATVDGAQLWLSPESSYLIPGGSMMILEGREYNSYVLVRVPRAALGLTDETAPPEPDVLPNPTVSTVDGWALADALHLVDQLAVVTAAGAHLRLEPAQQATNIGLVRGGQTVAWLGITQNEFLLVRVRRDDFVGPVNLPNLPPTPAETPSTPVALYLGWVESRFLERRGRYAQVKHPYGVTLRAAPQTTAPGIGLLKGRATVALAGADSHDFTPIQAHPNDVLNPAQPMPAIQPPQPLPLLPDAPPETPPHNTVAGWILTSDLVGSGEQQTVGAFIASLRQAPRRNAELLGFAPAHSPLFVTGPASGEYTPVRLDDTLLIEPATELPGLVLDEPMVMGPVRLGLHASADPDISEAEIREFQHTRPGVIKLLSFHPPEAIARLADDHPQALWIVRAFLDFGGRRVTPDQFVSWTLSDVQRTLDVLKGRELLVELHNEPNTHHEGLGRAWADGRDFSQWWLEVQRLYRTALPGVPLLYPGLSPGGSVAGVRQDHIEFLEASRPAVAAADGLGVHLYWSRIFPMTQALAVLDDIMTRFRGYTLYITEASNNDRQAPPEEKARDYITFWQQLTRRPPVRGVTYFVASASNPAFASEVWVGRGIGQIVGRR